MPAGRKPPQYAPVDPPAAELTDRELYADGTLTVEAAARFMCCSVRSVWQMLIDGELPYTQPGQRRLIPKRAIVDRLAAHSKRNKRVEQ